MGVFSTMVDITSTVGRYHEYRGDIMMHVVGYHECRGGCSVSWGYHPLYIEYSGGYHDTRGGHHEYRGSVQYRGVLKQQKIPPAALNTPTVLMISPTYIMIPPMVLSIATVLKITPTVLMIYPAVLNTPTVLKRSPHAS